MDIKIKGLTRINLSNNSVTKYGLIEDDVAMKSNISCIDIYSCSNMCCDECILGGDIRKRIPTKDRLQPNSEIYT